MAILRTRTTPADLRTTRMWWQLLLASRSVHGSRAATNDSYNSPRLFDLLHRRSWPVSFPFSLAPPLVLPSALL